MATITKNIQLQKQDVSDELRLVSGWASVVTDDNGAAVVDLQGDIIPVSELQRAVHELLASGGGLAGVNHEIEGVGPIVDSIVLTQDLRKRMEMNEGKEGWFITVRVDNDDAWQRVKSGELLSFSISAEAESHEVADDA
jgi:hypothetical protein